MEKLLDDLVELLEKHSPAKKYRVMSAFIDPRTRSGVIPIWGTRAPIGDVEWAIEYAKDLGRVHSDIVYWAEEIKVDVNECLGT